MCSIFTVIQPIERELKKKTCEPNGVRCVSQFPTHSVSIPQLKKLGNRESLPTQSALKSPASLKQHLLCCVKNALLMLAIKLDQGNSGYQHGAVCTHLAARQWKITANLAFRVFCASAPFTQASSWWTLSRAVLYAWLNSEQPVEVPENHDNEEKTMDTNVKRTIRG